MFDNLFNSFWFFIFLLVILIGLIGNMMIIFSIWTDRSMHTPTYFYIINVNIADILLLLTCLPERVAEAFRTDDGFHLGMLTCYLLPFFQQVSMHSALGFLLVLTIHRCYPTGVPHCLQGDFIRRQIRCHFQTLIFIWFSAIVINLPLFSITKYNNGESSTANEAQTNNGTNTFQATCETEATSAWSRIYLILLLVSTYLVTGLFLILIYGQAIRLILATKKFRNQPKSPTANRTDESRLSSRNLLGAQENTRTTPQAHSSTSSTPNKSLNRRTNIHPVTLRISHHSSQHLQVIIILFIVILLYIILLLPYRLLNLLFIVHNQLFQKNFINDFLFLCLLNTVRLLVFLNCALQPMIYVIISSRLRHCVVKCLKDTWSKVSCHCRCIINDKIEDHHQMESRLVATHQIKDEPIRYRYEQNQLVHHENSPAHLQKPSGVSLNKPRKFPYKVTFTNIQQK